MDNEVRSSFAQIGRGPRAALMLILFLFPLLFLGNYAGDAEIHLVFGATAAGGDFFQFNPGEPVPGVTSPGYMLILGGLFHVFPASVVPIAVKALNLGTWYALIVVTFRLGRRIGLDAEWAWAAAVVAGLLPGSAYNSTIGMENGVFALMVYVWLDAALRSNWFSSVPVSRRRDRVMWSEAALGLLLGAAVWLRPEGVVIGILALVVRLRRLRSAVVARTIVFTIAFASVVLMLMVFHYAFTGFLLPGSGRARMIMGSLGAVWIGPIPLNGRVATRLAAYFPLTLMWLVGIATVWRRTLAPDAVQSMSECLVLIACVSFGLYSSILGAAHLARYLTFVMPAFVLIAAVGARRLWSGGMPRTGGWLDLRRKPVVIAMAGVLAIIFAVETRERLRIGGRGELLRVVNAPHERSKVSDALMGQLGSPTHVPVVVAYQEVQERYWLDDRFVVRSLDGRTDPVLLAFANRQQFDHLGYIKARGIRYLAELPNYNGDKRLWSLANLTRLAPLEQIERDGLVFTRLPGLDRLIKVEPVR